MTESRVWRKEGKLNTIFKLNKQTAIKEKQALEIEYNKVFRMKFNIILNLLRLYMNITSIPGWRIVPIFLFLTSRCWCKTCLPHAAYMALFKIISRYHWFGKLFFYLPKARTLNIEIKFYFSFQSLISSAK